jgi:hypothetical protein
MLVLCSEGHVVVLGAESEIGEFDSGQVTPVSNQYVIWLKIPMHDALLVDIHDCL